MSKIETILFDIGGVLTPDPWETILLDRKHGLYKDLGTEQELAERVKEVWGKYSLIPDGHEESFWQEMSHALGVNIDIDAANEAKKAAVIPNRQSAETFDRLAQQGVSTGIISNNTAFFYRFQSEVLNLKERGIDPSLIFLSHERGKDKSDGLFEQAAQIVVPRKTIIVDDRPGNIEYAEFLGFQTIHYSMMLGRTSLLAEVQDAVNQNI